MDYFYDFEFLDNGRTIQPISVGVVADSGTEYYAVFKDAPWGLIYRHEWLMANVVPHLPQLSGWSTPRVNLSDPVCQPGAVIAHELSNFFQSNMDDDGIHLYGWYSAYDHVCLAQLWGPMINLPDFMPMYTRDLKQDYDRLRVTGVLTDGDVKPEPVGVEHNALADARWNRTMRDWLVRKEHGVQADSWYTYRTRSAATTS